VGAALFAVAQGFDPAWLFAGIERQYLYAVVASLSRLLVLLAAILLVKEPADGWIVMFLHAAGAGATIIAALVYASVKYPRSAAAPGSMTRMLRTGWAVFQFRVVQSIGGLTLLVLGVVSPKSVEAFGSADRIARLSLGLLGPISGAGMPHIAKLIGSDVSGARRVARLNFAVMAGFGLLVGLIMFAFTPLITYVILGPGYEFVAPILRVIALILPISAASNMIAVQWMLPLGLERLMVRISLIAGLSGIAGCALFGWLYGAMGAAISSVLVEVGLLIGTILTLLWCKHPTFWGEEKPDLNPAKPSSSPQE
jgi:PST family polysaccharide transporter